MKFKKLLLCASLGIALMGQSLWATDAVDASTDPAAARNLALTRQVERFMDRAHRATALALESADEERKTQYLQPALDELGDALRLLSNDLDLKGADGELLVTQIYFSQGAAFENVPTRACVTPGCNCGDQHKQRAAKSYFKARLASTDAAAFPALGTIEPAVATMMSGFNTVYDELVADTDLTHAGIAERFKRFDTKFAPQERRRGPSTTELEERLSQMGVSLFGGGMPFQMGGQPGSGNPLADMFSRGRQQQRGRGGFPLGQQRGSGSAVMEMFVVMPGQSPFASMPGADWNPNAGQEEANMIMMAMQQAMSGQRRPTTQQGTPTTAQGPRVIDIHTDLAGLERVAALLSAGTLPDAAADSTQEGSN